MASHIMQILEQFRAQGIGDNYVLLKINLYRYNGIAKCYKTVRPTKDSERVYNKIWWLWLSLHIVYQSPIQSCRSLQDIYLCNNRQTSGESASLPQYLGCNTVFDMRLRVTFLRRKTVSLQSNIAHRE
jgi:hypothetical protein